MTTRWNQGEPDSSRTDIAPQEAVRSHDMALRGYSAGRSIPARNDEPGDDSDLQVDAQRHRSRCPDTVDRTGTRH